MRETRVHTLAHLVGLLRWAVVGALLLKSLRLLAAASTILPAFICVRPVLMYLFTRERQNEPDVAGDKAHRHEHFSLEHGEPPLVQSVGA
jgi:hypothetical protein